MERPEHVGAPGDPEPEELRLAVVLNGGVSLAVWMGGVTQELDAVRRAGGAGGPGGGTTGTDALYRPLLAALGSRVRIDVVAGASAGGINGALLAAAAANGDRLDRGAAPSEEVPPGARPDGEVKAIWLEDGSFEALIRDPDDRVDGRSPPSLLRGDEHLGRRLREVLGGFMTRPGGAPPGASRDPGERVSLLLTGTDARGLRRHVMGRIGFEEHRLLFRFRHPAVPADDRAGLRRENVDQLAGAARATASFPGAFEPARAAADDYGEGLTGRDGRLDHPDAGRNARLRWVIDGGVLDNAPFGPIVAEMERIRGREVGERVLLYVTPYHVGPPLPGGPNPRPGFVETVGRGLSLPRLLTAMNDLPRVAAYREGRERAFEAVRDLLAATPDADLRDAAGRLIGAYRGFRLRAVFGDEEVPSGAPDWIPGSISDVDAGAAGWSFGHAPARRIAALTLAALSRARRRLEDGWSEAGADWATRVRRLRDAEARTASVLTTLASREERRRRDLPPEGTRARREWLLAPWPARERALRGAAALRCARELTRARGEIRDATGWDPGDDAGPLLARLLAAEVVLGAGATRPGLDESTPAVDVGLEVLDPGEADGGVDDTGRPIASPAARDPARKLAGASLRHFGGFVDRAWRENDWRWGRLDGARRIVDIVLTRRRLRLAAQDGPGLDRLAADLAGVVVAGLDEGALADPEVRDSLRAALGGHDLPEGREAVRRDVAVRLRAHLAEARADDGDRALERVRRAVAWRLWLEVLGEELPDPGGPAGALARFASLPSPSADGALYGGRMPLVVASSLRIAAGAAAPPRGRVVRRLGGALLRGAAWAAFVVAAAFAGPPAPRADGAAERWPRRLALAPVVLALLGAAQGAFLMPGRWSGAAGQALSALGVVAVGFLLGVLVRAAGPGPRALGLVGAWLAGGAAAVAALAPFSPGPGVVEWSLAGASLGAAAALTAALALRLRRAGSRPAAADQSGGA